MFRSSRKEKKGKGSWFLNLSKSKRIIIISALVILVGFVGGGVIYASRLSNLDIMFPGVDFPDDGHDDDPSIIDVRDAFNNLEDRFLNILLVGFDTDEDRADKNDPLRADTLMLLTINTVTNKIDLLSIPRDSLVPIYKRGGGRDKINSAYGYGWKYGGAPKDDLEARHRMGMEYQVQTVSREVLGGIPIHYYVTIDMQGVIDVVNIMGGVWYDIEKRVYHNTGRILFEPGYQHLDGKKFLYFVRSRQWSDGDIQRVRNQQDILIAAFDQFKKADKLINAPQVYASVRDNVDTNLTMEQILSLTWFGIQHVDKENISQHVMPTSFAWGRLQESWTKSYSYLLINQQKRVDLIYEIWGVRVEQKSNGVLYPPLPNEDPSDDSDHPFPGLDDGENPDPGGETPGPGENDPDPGEPGGDTGSGDSGEDPPGIGGDE